ncbi:MAG: phosphoglucomutase/phosphomannomutase family protein [Coriobacteriales bacterium]|jgi:phosphomannomutase|nr:phosphoglucomutase/phosphomannomutase family protein [Coriobacteriales bacterium]
MATTESFVSDVHFGTDGWRAVIDEGFNLETLARVADATARAYQQLLDQGVQPSEFADENSNTLIIGYDCRRNAGKFAAFFAEIVARQGFDVLVTDRYCPTPALCWTVAHTRSAIGGIMLTASHNPAEYLGVKLRMSDGGASPAWFSDIVEALLQEAEPPAFSRAVLLFDQARSATPASPARDLQGAGFSYADILTDYLEALSTSVDSGLIRKANLSVVIDPLYGSGRGYLAGLLTNMGVQVSEVNAADDPNFGGLHPEPIMPWVSVGAAQVVELGAAAGLITDGDADRIGAIDDRGDYVTSHRIISLLIAHLVESRGQTGRVVRTSAGSNLIRRQCQRLGLTLTSKPIGFKWVYEEMLKGDVLIGGEESGGFGIPQLVRERDGLLMALLLVEMMATRQKTMSELVDELLSELGVLEYGRRDLRLSLEQQNTFLDTYVKLPDLDYSAYLPTFNALGEKIVELERVDGIMLRFASDAWLLARPSGTEPLVRVYAEAETNERVQELLDIGEAMAEGTLQL